MRTTHALLGASLGILAACAKEGAEGGIVRTEVGDTAVIEIAAEVDSTSVPATVEILWRGAELGEPNSLAVSERYIAVGDRDRVHILDRQGQHLLTVGQEGEGPGEFRRIRNLAWIGDTLAVLDGRNRRLTRLGPRGEVFGTEALDLHPDFPNIRLGQALWFHDGAMLQVVEGLTLRDAPMQVGIYWGPREGRSGELEATFEGTTYRDYGAILAAAELFGPQAVAAVGPGGRFAYGNWLESCILTGLVDSDARVRICRDWPTTEVGPGTRNATARDLPNYDNMRPQMREAVENVFREQPVGDRLPFYDALMFSDNGELWVRALGPNPPDVHPWVLARDPGLAADGQRWEVYGPAGDPGGAVLLPREFEPLSFQSGHAYGLLELATGELAVARAEWQGA